MKRHTLTLTNDFHNTSVSLRVELTGFYAYLSPAQARRARRALCGVAGCTCGGTLGERGSAQLNGQRCSAAVLESQTGSVGLEIVVED
jgi:hypothetical protein